MAVTVLNESGRRIPVHPIQRAARAALRAERAGPAEVNVVLTDDGAIHRFNLEYRGVDAPTDVLSFSFRDMPDGPATPATPGLAIPLGDIVVSAETAARQAERLGHSLEHELSLLVIHGILHLLGYDDETESGAAEMREREEVALRYIGVAADGLIARTLG